MTSEPPPLLPEGHYEAKIISILPPERRETKSRKTIFVLPMQIEIEGQSVRRYAYGFLEALTMLYRARSFYEGRTFPCKVKHQIIPGDAPLPGQPSNDKIYPDYIISWS